MKKYLIILFFLSSLPVLAQRNGRVVKNNTQYDEKPIHFGFTVGFDRLDFIVHKSEDFLKSDSVYSIETVKGFGFHLGPICNIRLGEYFDLRYLITLTFGSRTLDYTFIDTINTTSEKMAFTKRTVNVESIFIESPLLLKYKAMRIDNYRPYLIAGVNPKLDLSARKALKPEEYGKKIRLQTFDVYYEAGFGIDFYLPYFKFSTEFKYSLGMKNILFKDGTPYTSSIDKMSSKMFVFSFHFE